jgi:hypothetical protein
MFSGLFMRPPDVQWPGRLGHLIVENEKVVASAGISRSTRLRKEAGGALAGPGPGAADAMEGSDVSGIDADR